MAARSDCLTSPATVSCEGGRFAQPWVKGSTGMDRYGPRVAIAGPLPAQAERKRSLGRDPCSRFRSGPGAVRKRMGSQRLEGHSEVQTSPRRAFHERPTRASRGRSKVGRTDGAGHGTASETIGRRFWSVFCHSSWTQQGQAEGGQSKRRFARVLRICLTGERACRTYYRILAPRDICLANARHSACPRKAIVRRETRPRRIVVHSCLTCMTGSDS
jgi:hypothetical protein